MKAKTIKTLTRDLKNNIKDTKCNKLIDSVVTKLKYSSSPGSFVSFPYIQNKGEYKTLIFLLSSFIHKLKEMDYEEFPNILLIEIDNNISDFIFSDYSNFIEIEFNKFLNVIDSKVKEADECYKLCKIMDYNNLIYNYSLTSRGYTYIEEEGNNNIKAIQSDLDSFFENY